MAAIDVDYLGLAIGPPKHGKTTLAASVVEAKLREGFTVFAHDERHQYRTNRYYRTAEQWRAAAREAHDRKQPFARGASFGCPVEDAIDLAIAVGKRAGNRHDSVRRPILVVLDEASASEATATYLPPAYNRLISQRRHYGVGVLLLLQWPTQLHPAFLATATDVYLFRQSREHIPRLETQLHLGRGDLAHLAGAPKFKFVHVRPGEGIVAAQPTTARRAHAAVPRQDRDGHVPAPHVPASPGATDARPGASAGAPAPRR